MTTITSGSTTTGTTIRVLTLRATEISASGELGDSITRKYPVDLAITPVIEPGQTYRNPPTGQPIQIIRGVDKFKHFELDLRDRRLLRWDRDLKHMLKKPVALEFWTLHTVDGSFDPEFPWIHWVFPLTSWKKIGWGRYQGRSRHHGFARSVDFGVPDAMPIPDGGFWKTAIAPPTS